MKKSVIPLAPAGAGRHWPDLLLDPHRAMLERMAHWELPQPPPQPQVMQTSTAAGTVQIGQAGGDVWLNSPTHIGSQVNHITLGSKAPQGRGDGLLDHDDPTSWPELLRESVWGGL